MSYPYIAAKEKSREEKKKAAIRPHLVQEMEEALSSEKRRGKKDGPQ